MLAILAAGALVALIVAPTWFTLAGLHRNIAALSALRARHPAAVSLLYLGLYIVLAALSVPGLAVLSLGGAALFGLWQGVVLTSFGSTLGATLAMLASRTLLRDLLARRFAGALRQVDQGLAGDGWVYLASLRLAPVFPFSLVNLLFGLTRFPVARFYIVSQLCMLPATIVYVNAGMRLDALAGLSHILSPSLLGALLLLALLGPASRVIMRRLGFSS
ncbi:MAG: TVP38/TMEM64 family protein [Rhodospirillales bacterium]|nr:TVP38/TMEM64 family protein [Rhodospirillales bacterium]